MRTIIAALSILLALPALVFSADFQFQKYSYEEENVGVNFKEAIAGVTIDGVTAVLVNNAATQPDATSTVIAASPAPLTTTGTYSNSMIVFRVKGGSAGSSYLISISAVRIDTGEKLRNTVLMQVLKERN